MGYFKCVVAARQIAMKLGDRGPRRDGAGPGRWRHRSPVLLALVVLLAIATEGRAAGNHTIEGGGIYYDLSDALEATYGEYARLRLETSATDAWLTDITSLNRFGDDGTQVSLGNVHQFSDRWYTQVYVASSAGGFFWPRFRIDALLSHKWLRDKRLVTTIGAGYFDAKDVHEDRNVSVDASYYFEGPWVVQGGVQNNVSDPGSVDSTSGYAAASYVRQHARIISVRGSVGRQAYQAVAADNFVVDFPFHSIRLTWREWVGNTWGITVAAEQYSSDVYDQRGFELGFFKEF